MSDVTECRDGILESRIERINTYADMTTAGAAVFAGAWERNEPIRDGLLHVLKRWESTLLESLRTAKDMDDIRSMQGELNMIRRINLLPNTLRDLVRAVEDITKPESRQ